MLLTKPQQRRFWREWSAACTAQGWTKAASWTGAKIDHERHALLARAGFDSLTLVDTGGGFDRVLAQLALLTDQIPRPVETEDSEPGDRRRILWLIKKHAHPLGGDPYILALARGKFHLTAGLGTIEDLTTAQLHQLMITLNARRKSALRASAPPRAAVPVVSEDPF